MLPPGLSLSVADPLWKSGRRDWIASLTPTGYTHTIQAKGGYWSAGFTIPGNLQTVEEWLDEGLGRHIVVHDDSLSVVWEGYTSQITGNAGGRTVSRGPLTDVMNHVYTIFNVINRDTIPPTSGVKITTAIASDLDSQDRWGLMYGIVSQLDVTLAEAERTRDRVLAERAEPKLTRSFGGAGSAPSVQVECLGYWHYMIWPYNYTASGGLIDLSNQDGTGKMQLILAADPNGIFSTDWTRTANNTGLVPEYENDDRPANELIADLTDLGDASFNRWLFGIYEDRQAVYAMAPSTVEYIRQLRDPAGQIRTPQGGIVMPWNVMPGKWLKWPDFNVGRLDMSDLREDSRCEFLESVTYTAPWGLTWRGGDVDTLTQYLKQRGV